MTRLVLRRGTVVEAGPADGPEQRLVVDVPGRGPRPAVGDVALVGAGEVGDDVVVNTQAADLALGSGGFDVVHVNLSRGLGGAGVPGAHVMKLNYASLQHAVVPVEETAGGDGGARAVEGEERSAAEVPVGVFGLHGQLPAIAWAVGQAAPGARLGYVQTPGGALPGSHSRVVRELRERGLLAGHLTAGAAYGGADGDAITTAGALDHGVRELGWDAAVVGPGPGILGSGSAFGHGGMVALESAHTALALGHPVVLCARMSGSDPRPRHRGLSHHTATVLRLLLRPVVVALPAGEAPPSEVAGAHGWVFPPADLEGYAASGLPATSMGREDPLFFAAALVCGMALTGSVGP
ncbi:DUF3866 family protein [Conexibacter sp. SYSU D00693]|uniref:DUF3866 family protein n=1 Tax=Conexibacter sp. SYSU D00693 TaxID=2812560 RepID=UPI00196A4ED6|nr:DUF3866 family protein [Conexibacter sp. SYSU D00693]